MNIAADIPLDLADADEALTLYGRWAADRESRRRCGSAEGHYRPESWHALEDRRTPLGFGLTLQDALICQRALARVPDRERVVHSGFRSAQGGGRQAVDCSIEDENRPRPL